MEVCAPVTVQAKLAARLARVALVLKSMPPSNPAARTPTKVSPAPVVSRGVTEAVSTEKLVPEPATIAPSAPNVRIQVIHVVAPIAGGHRITRTLSGPLERQSQRLRPR